MRILLGIWLRQDIQITKFTGPARKSKNKIVSFRVPQDVLDNLEYIAYKKELTTNAHVRNVLIKHVRWDIYAENFGFVPVPKQLLMTLLKESDPNKIAAFVSEMHLILKDWVIHVKGRYDLKRCIESLEDFMKSSGFDADHKLTGDIHTYTIHHKCGYAWSIFGQEMLKKISTNLFQQNELNSA